MYLLGYDTETTGLPLFKEPSEDPRQPHLMQLGAVLVDCGTREIVHSLDVIIRPQKDWTYEQSAIDAHGITPEYAELVGISEHKALEMLMQMWDVANFRVAHNEPFDARIIRIGLKRYDCGVDADDWKAGASECTQTLATPILKLPPTAKMRAAGRHHHKSANLGEAYEYFTGKKHEKAHRAMNDVMACLAVYWAIKGDKPIEAPEAQPRDRAAPAPAAPKAAAPVVDLGNF